MGKASRIRSFLRNIFCWPCCLKDNKGTISGSSHSSTPSLPRSMENVIIRVHLENGRGKVSKQILVTNEERSPAVIQRAMAKFNLDGDWQDYHLVLIVTKDRAVVIPDDANIYYAVGPVAKVHFVLKKKDNCSQLGNGSANSGV